VTSESRSKRKAATVAQYAALSSFIGLPVTEEEPVQIVKLRQPTQCILWEHPGRVAGQFAQAFEVVESYEDGSHWSRSLYKCRECGQLYIYEWYEWVDWQHGNDKQYSTFVPVQTAEEIAALKQTDTFSLLRFFPRLQWDGSKMGRIGKWPDGNPRRLVQWSQPLGAHFQPI
jgi:hypothetical protein